MFQELNETQDAWSLGTYVVRAWDLGSGLVAFVG
jgi:hypothetical protein